MYLRNRVTHEEYEHHAGWPVTWKIDCYIDGDDIIEVWDRTGELKKFRRSALEEVPEL